MLKHISMERELRKNKALWALFDAITALDDREECARFLRDLCTLTELEAMAERWEVAQMIMAQKPYRQISELTGASTATITRIAHWVRHGEGGYKHMMEKLEGPAEDSAKVKG